MEFTVPPHTSGPPPHWHMTHDETFLVTSGTLTFSAAGGVVSEAKAGDYVVVPTKAPHTFSNESDEPAVFFNTFTPAFYVNYFKLLSKLQTEGKMGKETVGEAMAMYATMPVKGANSPAGPR